MKGPPDMPEAVGAICPYCNQILEKRPQRKKKCPHCGNYIFVRSRQELFPFALLTEQDARVADHFETLKGMGSFDVSEDDFFREREELAERFGRQPDSGDVLWSLYNRLVYESTPSRDSVLPFLYFLMAHFLYEEGKEFRHLLEQSRKMELTEYKKDGVVEKVFIITAGDASCEACQKLDGKVFTVDEALDQMPIPCKDCTFDFQGTGQPGWCRCLYGAAFD
jgi:hypothetical protein